MLSTVIAGGGCNGNLTNNSQGAPSACGGSRTVTFTYTSTCAPLTSSVQATFTVPNSPAVVLTAPTNTTTAACLTQEAVNSAYAAWLSTVISSGGCNGNLTNNSQGAPSACGGSRTVTFTYTSTCAPLTSSVQATFTVPAPATLVVNAPVNSSNSYTNQADADAAFLAWLAGFNFNGGCNPSGSYGQPTPPPYCGGTRTVTYTVNDYCHDGPVIVSATFVITGPPNVVVATPNPINSSTSSCAYPTQVEANAAFTAWLNQFGVSGGLNPSGSFIGTPTAPPYCSGTTTVTYVVTDSCYETTTHVGAFTIVPGAPVDVTGPSNSSTSSCAYANQAAVDTAFAAWLAQFTVTNVGCNSPTNNQGSFNINQFQAPRLCAGGSITLTYSYSDNCTQDSASATFTITPSAAVDVTGPSNSTTSVCAYADQAAVDTAFAAWLAQFQTLNHGCDATANFNLTEIQAPRLCVGGNVALTYSIADNCSQDSTSATFTITPAPAVVPHAPENNISGACAYVDQAAATAAFNAWLAGFTVSGGCAPLGSYGQVSAPAFCGGTTTVTYTVTDKCYVGTPIVRTFTISPAPAVSLTCPINATISGGQTQAAVNQAFATWLATATASGGCNGVLSNNSEGAPSFCGGTTTVIFTYSNRCGADTTCQATFTVQPCGSIGNFVWNDYNNNGVQDLGEPGLQGVTVTLNGCGLSLTTTTDSNGAYLFSNLPPCTYTIGFGTPSGYTPSPANQGGNDATDSDPVAGTVSVVLASGENNTTIDAGFFNPGSIGNFVWNDLNHNGIQDLGEPGIPGVTVTLTGCAISMSTTTDLNGAYLFSNLPPCTYTVTFGTPSGYIATGSNLGANDAIDSDPVGGVVSVVLGVGENNLTIDAGFFIPALEGCTLGYWKNHTNRWCDSYRTCDRFGDVFTSAPASLANLTLLQALNLGGGGIYNLARQGVAALLNTCSNQVAYAGYGDNSQSVIDAINLAYSTGGNAPGILGSRLDVFNNSGCPLGGTRATSVTNCTSAQRMSATVYPNPSANNFNIKLSTVDTEKVSIVVYDMLGRLVDSQELDTQESLEIKVGSKYPTGIYNVVVTQGTEVKTVRVIKR